VISFEPLERYFHGEKLGAAFLIAVAVVALAVSIVVWRAGWWFRAIAFPLGIVAVLQLAIGVVLRARPDGQVAALKQGLGEQAETARAAEITRMEKVNTSFRWIEIAEVVLIALGIAMALGMRARPTVSAVGMGILLQAALLLVFDLIAEARAHVYVAWLKSLG
jgi:hypothetical protein